MTNDALDCLFCKIVAQNIPCKTVFESETLLAFEDIKPQAPTHLLIIPKQHIATLNDLKSSEQMLLGDMLLCAKSLAQQYGIADAGYRTLFNCNQQGGQEVYHIHLHLLGGRQMNWPPG